jgi:hypothetical protein
MADYYPLIARAVAGLDPNAPSESRRALYERARTALISQLRGVQPALSEAEITRERLALEEAVRRVESEFARRAPAPETPPRPDAAPAAPSEPGEAAPPPKPSLSPRREGPRPGDALRESARHARGAAPPPPGRDRPLSGRSENGAPEPRPPRNLRGDQPPPRPQPPGGLPNAMRDIRPPRDTRIEEPHPARPPQGPAAGPRGARGMRDVVADADDLGRAAAHAGRAARRSQAGQEGGVVPPAAPRGGAEVPYSYDESAEEAGSYQPRPPERSRGERAASRGFPERSGHRFPLKGAIILGLVLLLAGAGVLIYQKLYPSLRATLKPAAPVVDAQKDNGTRPKITDRVGQPGTQQVAPVAQRVVLYDEDPSAPQGKQYVGSVIWRTEAVKGAAGQPADIGVRADIDVPERKFKMSLSIRRNTDASLPASHTAELTFMLPPDFGATVANVPGILMKSNEQARGTPLAGLAVKVTDGFFLVGLSNVEADRSRNLQLLKERSWFDIPLVYSNQRRSIVAIEKGAPGERAFNEAFTAWGQ